MGQVFKGILAAMTCLVIACYVMGIFLIDAHFGGRVGALEKEQAAIDVRSAELQRRAVELEGARMRLSIQIAVANENDRLASADPKPRPLALGKMPSVAVSLPAAPTFKAPIIKTNTSLADQIKKLANLRSGSSSSSGGSTSASGGSSSGSGSGGGSSGGGSSPPPVTRAS